MLRFPKPSIKCSNQPKVSAWAFPSLTARSTNLKMSITSRLNFLGVGLTLTSGLEIVRLCFTLFPNVDFRRGRKKEQHHGEQTVASACRILAGAASGCGVTSKQDDWSDNWETTAET